MKLKYIITISIILVVIIAYRIGPVNNNYINDYGKYLNIKFPKGIEMIYTKYDNNFQDFSNFSIYNLSDTEKDSIVKQITPRLCADTCKKTHHHWVKSGNFYHLKTSDSTLTSRYYIKAILTAENGINTLMIEEVDQ